MKKKDFLLGMVFGGLLIKIIRNQYVIDEHICRCADGYTVWEDELLHNNTIWAKIQRWNYNRKHKDKSN